jgi:hypothetical protein
MVVNRANSGTLMYTQCAPAMALRWLAAASEAVVSHPV